jgi:hypothetical protein
MKKKKYYLKNHCIECNKLIHYQSTRCRKCANKQLLKIGQRRDKQNYYCIQCNSKISWSSALYGTALCRSCCKNKFHITIEQLSKDYIDENKSIVQIAKEYNCSNENIYAWLLKLDIPIRTKTESHKGKKRPEHSKLMMGENNPNFNNWSSLEPYTFEFTNDFKDSIRNRDNYKCQYCDKIQKQELKDNNRKLSIHHIDYNKTNCKEENLVSLCDKCHCKSNFNRDFWFAYFTEIINKIYQLI